MPSQRGGVQGVWALHKCWTFTVKMVLVQVQPKAQLRPQGLAKGRVVMDQRSEHTHTQTHTHTDIAYRSIPLLGIVPFLRCFEALVGFEILQIMLRSTTDTAILKIRMLLQGSRPNSWA